ncbi:hypothetical protein LTR94_029773, partial [Friedmanniomyces endolithicus]
MKSISIAAAAAVLAGLAAAPTQAAEVEIKNAVARVVVIVEDRNDVAVEITQGRSSLPNLQVRRSGSDVEIDGGLRRSGVFGSSQLIGSCNSGPAGASQPGQGAMVEVRGMGRVQMEDAPLVVLRTPRDVVLNSNGAVFGAIGR